MKKDKWIQLNNIESSYNFEGDTADQKG